MYLLNTFFLDIQFKLFSYFLKYIQQAIRKDFSNIDEVLMPPDSQDVGVWKYEHLRYGQLVVKLLWTCLLKQSLCLGEFLFVSHSFIPVNRDLCNSKLLHYNVKIKYKWRV